MGFSREYKQDPRRPAAPPFLRDVPWRCRPGKEKVVVVSLENKELALIESEP